MIEKNSIKELIRKKIINSIDVFFLEVVDESHKHKNHLLIKKENSHFYINIVSNQFLNKSKIQRHKQLYRILSEFLKHDVHALRINARTIDEFK